jgi:dihydrofolate reductase
MADASRLSLIVAMTRAGVIGRRGALPWRLSADLKRFKALTMGHAILMGRKTFASLGRVLPGRTSIVITRQPDFPLPPDVRVAHSLEDALLLASSDESPFVIGGGEIYRQAIDRASRLYVTWVEAEVDGDTHFPDWDRTQWRLTEQVCHSADAKNEYQYTFAVYDRRISRTTETAEPATSAIHSSPTRYRLESPTTEDQLAMTAELNEQLLELNQKLLVAIVSGDWNTYVSLCDPSITCFEPEARGQVVVGMPFHKYYFDLSASPQKPAKQVTMSQPHVRLMGDSAAVLSYVRLTQSLDASGAPQTGRMEETRVWQKIGGQWKHVHFHRSAGA